MRRCVSMESLLSGSRAKAKGLQVHERNRKESGYGWSKPVDNSKVGGGGSGARDPPYLIGLRVGIVSYKSGIPNPWASDWYCQ